MADAAIDASSFGMLTNLADVAVEVQHNKFADRDGKPLKEPIGSNAARRSQARRRMQRVALTRAWRDL